MADSSQIEVLTSAKNLALLKLGRNIHNFGLVEQWLKYLVSTSDVTTIGTKLDSKTTRKIDKTQKSMLGILICDFLDKLHPDNLSAKIQIQDLFDIQISTSIRIEMNMNDYRALKQSFEEMVQDRNTLVHQFSKIFPLNTAENCHEAVVYLDEQREKHLPTMHYLQGLVKTQLDLIEEYKDTFNE
jgi:hypothetical protein